MKVFCLESVSGELKQSKDGSNILGSYSNDIDAISFHNLKLFDSINEYLLCLLHEIGHATGHASRLNRKLGSDVSDRGTIRLIF